MKRLALTAAVCGALLGGCSGGDPEPIDVAVTAASPSSAASPSPTASASPEPTEAFIDPSNPLGDLQVPFGDPVGGPIFSVSHGHGVEGVTTWEVGGSGCTPPAPDALPDGVWFGFIVQWGPDEIGFNLVCVDGYGRRTTRDYTAIGTIPVAANAQYLLGWKSSYAFSFAQVAAARKQYPPPTTSNAVWLYINGGEVTQVEAASEAKDESAQAAGTPYVPWGPELTAARGTAGAHFPVVETTEWGITYVLTPEEDRNTAKGALGSGCSPSSGDSLPDGAWFAYIVDMDEDSIDVDLACFWGHETWPKNGPDAEECWEVEGRGLNNTRCNDPQVSNDNMHVRTNPLALDAQVVIDYGSSVYSAVAVGALENHFWPIDLTYGNWIYVNDGEVTAIAEISLIWGWSPDCCGCC